MRNHGCYGNPFLGVYPFQPILDPCAALVVNNIEYSKRQSDVLRQSFQANTRQTSLLLENVYESYTQAKRTCNCKTCLPTLSWGTECSFLMSHLRLYPVYPVQHFPFHVIFYLHNAPLQLIPGPRGRLFVYFRMILPPKPVELFAGWIRV